MAEDTPTLATENLDAKVAATGAGSVYARAQAFLAANGLRDPGNMDGRVSRMDARTATQEGRAAEMADAALARINTGARDAIRTFEATSQATIAAAPVPAELRTIELKDAVITDPKSESYVRPVVISEAAPVPATPAVLATPAALATPVAISEPLPRAEQVAPIALPRTSVAKLADAPVKAGPPVRDAFDRASQIFFRQSPTVVHGPLSQIATSLGKLARGETRWSKGATDQPPPRGPEVAP